MHRINARLDPTVSARGVKIEGIESKESIDDGFQMSSTNENNDSMNALSDATDKIVNTMTEDVTDQTKEVLDIDKDATSKAIIEALRAVGSDFKATANERKELKKYVCGTGNANSDKRMKIAFVFICALGLVAYTIKRNNNKENSSTYDGPVTIASVN